MPIEWAPDYDLQAVTKKIIAQFDEIRAAAKKAGVEFRAMVDAFVDDRWRYGRNNFRADGSWVSDMCSAWLHEACELPDKCNCKSRACPHNRKEPE